MRAKEFIVEANSQQEPSARQQFLTKVIGPESGGRHWIQNPHSSATGLFQFIKSTWDNTVKKAKPGDPHYGVSFKDMKNNVAAQRAAADQISREYEQSIKRNNLPNTPGMYYLLHGHGPKALELYNNPDKQLKDVYDPYARDKKGNIIIDPKTGKPKPSVVYQQNPDFKPNQKISDFIAVRANKVGDTITNLYPGNTRLAKVTPNTNKVAKTDTDTTTPTPAMVPPIVTKTKDEPNIVSQYVDANIPKKELGIVDKAKKAVSDVTGSSIAPKTATANVAPTKTNPELIPGTPEYDARMEKLQTTVGDKFSKERAERLEREEEIRQEKRMADIGDKWSSERAAAKNQTTQPPQDDSYYTKFKNLFK